jgi:hypothetical protein
MVRLDTTAMNTELPSAQQDLGFGADTGQWVLAAYSLAFGSPLGLLGLASAVGGAGALGERAQR